MARRSSTRIGRAPAPRTIVVSGTIRAVAVAVGAVASIVLTQLLVAEPARIDELTLRNPTEYAMFVSLSGDGDGSASLVLGVVAAGGTVVLEDVLDPGPRWRLTLVSQGRTAGELRLDREDVRAAAGIVTIPEEAAQVLRDGAVPVTPNRS